MLVEYAEIPNEAGIPTEGTSANKHSCSCWWVMFLSKGNVAVDNISGIFVVFVSCKFYLVFIVTAALSMVIFMFR